MKKNLFIVLILLFAACGYMFAGGQGEAAVEGVKAAMATDVGGLGDKSFNDGSYAGLELAKEKLSGVTDIAVVESKEMTDYVPNLTGLAEDGANIVFAVGFLMADAIIESGQNYPDTYFAGIDIWVDPETAPKNVLGIQFKEHESGYLAGVVAGLMTKEYASASDRLNDKNVVGAVLGMDIPPVERFQAGYYAGVKSVNPDCKVLSVVTGTFNDLAKGKEAAIAMIEQGADIIFQIAGLTGLGALQAANERNVCGIGVDVDQYAEAPAAIITSAEKKITQATYLVIESVVNGTFEGGTNIVYGIEQGATGLAPYHEFEDVIPRAVKRAVENAIKDMKAGKISVPATRAEAGYEG
jgi:basic membrane protein A